MRFRRIAATLLVSGLGSLALLAAVPTLESLFPAGGRQGTTFTVTVAGKTDPWPASAWTDAPGVQFTASTNKGAFSVTISKDTPPGLYLVRVHNKDGASAPRWFEVGNLPEIEEKDGNESPAKAQKLESLPVTVNGRLRRSGDIGHFAVTLKKDQWIVAALDSYVLGSPIDPLLHLFDDQNVRVATAHDRGNLDPLLAWRATKDGNYTLQVAGFAHPPAADVRFAGSANTVFRLHISNGPVTQTAYPLAVRRDEDVSLQLLGWNQKDATAIFKPQQIPKDADSIMWLPPNALQPQRILVSTLPDILEAEPNSLTNAAQPITLPCVVHGRIDPSGDEDRFQFVAKKGEKWEFRVQSASLGIPVDAVLRLEDVAGKQLTRADDEGTGSDPRLTWTAPADGTNQIVVADLLKQSGFDHLYRLEIAAPTPDFSATLDAATFSLEAGKTNEIKGKLTRVNGHKEPLIARIEGLSIGATAADIDLPAGNGDFKLTVIAKPDATPTGAPIQIVIVPKATSTNAPARKTARFALRGEDIRGTSLLDHSDHAWITVTAPTPPIAPAKK
ncbi:MAG TPA: PPC domain-containing protein [Roseimicrobium sp.]|nr:PPC domain-containing protein [Roseimicrobium sp.]